MRGADILDNAESSDQDHPDERAAAVEDFDVPPQEIDTSMDSVEGGGTTYPHYSNPYHAVFPSPQPSNSEKFKLPGCLFALRKARPGIPSRDERDHADVRIVEGNVTIIKMVREVRFNMLSV